MLYNNLINFYLGQPWSVEGDYILRVQVERYRNPFNTCVECLDNSERVCCDNNVETECVGGDRCDTEFFYCLMPLGVVPDVSDVFDTVEEENRDTRAELLGCIQPGTALKSDVSRDTLGTQIEFDNDTVLGLPNPLEFVVQASKWQV